MLKFSIILNTLCTSVLVAVFFFINTSHINLTDAKNNAYLNQEIVEVKKLDGITEIRETYIHQLKIYKANVSKHNDLVHEQLIYILAVIVMLTLSLGMQIVYNFRK